MRRQSLVAIALFLLLAGCEASFSSASLSEPAIAAAVDPETKAPISPATTFPASTGSLYATIRVSYAPDGTSVVRISSTSRGAPRRLPPTSW